METEDTTQETSATDLLSDKEKESIVLFKQYINELVKFRGKGTASAAARARKNASELTHLLKVVRKELQEAKVQAAAARKAAKA